MQEPSASRDQEEWAGEVPVPDDPDTMRGSDPLLEDEEEQGDYTHTVATLAWTSGAEEEGDVVHVLTVVHGDFEGGILELGDSAIVVGRCKGADVQFADPRVSARHCTFALVMGQLLVTDLGSTNGTYMAGERISGSVILPVGGTVRVGGHFLRHDIRSRQELASWGELTRDLNKAARYVRSLFPAPLVSDTVEVDWHFVPCAKLGGDAFGYHWLDDDHFALYLIDVCGHGVEAALHSVSAINVMRRGSLAGVDYTRPDSVLAALGQFFVMEDHGNLYFTTWYGVYQASTRTLRFASAGHPPAFLIDRDHSRVRDLRTRNPPTGAAPEQDVAADAIQVAPGDRLFVFSDGAYEIVTTDGVDWELGDLRKVILAKSASADGSPERIHARVREASMSDLEDDFALMAVRFR